MSRTQKGIIYPDNYSAIADIPEAMKDMAESIDSVFEDEVIKSYSELSNKPKINDVTLNGNKTLNELNIQPKGNYADSRITNMEIENIFNDW